MKTSSNNERARANEARRGRLTECRLLVTVTSVVLQFGAAIVSVCGRECQIHFRYDYRLLPSVLPAFLLSFEQSLMQLPGLKVPQINQLRILLAILGFLFYPVPEKVNAQALKARITVASLSPARVLIEAEGPLSDTWSFRNFYGGITRLGERIENFQAATAQGESVSVRNLAPGEFRASTRVSRFSYEVRIDERSRLAELSHVSWINQERGFLMLADLLPQIGKETVNSSSATIEFKLPAGWTVASALRSNQNQQYAVSDIDDAVFYVGRALREKSVRVDSMEFVLVTSGDWAFADSDALELASKVARENSRLTKYRLPGRSVVMLAPFTEVVGPERWTADSRGSSVVLLMGRNASGRALLARLGIVLTHELFHLWVPNALALDGDYDWFFEGFTLYQALLTALRLDLIRFEDYLDTIARVYDSYRSLPDRDRLSLIEASERRWTASPSFVYDKGMLVAFIYDLKLRQASRNGMPVAEIYPQLFRQAAAGRGNANEVIMSI
jgi:predicted metalloprotease with PDZ domain